MVLLVSKNPYRMALDPDAEEFVPGIPWGLDLYAQEPPFVMLLKDVLYMLSTNPVAFYEYMSTVADAMNDSVQSNEQLERIADVIFEQSTLEPNFTYTGAKMCHYLVENLKLPKELKQFSSFINRRTKEVVIERHQLLSAPETAERVHGTTFFLAELFLMIEIEINGKMSKVYPYREALQELMEALVAKPNTSNLKCAGKVVKMIGSAVDDFDREVKNEQTNQRFHKLFTDMKHIIVDEKIDKTVKLMWIEIIELKASNWGRTTAPPISKEHVVTAGGDTGSMAAAISDDPVFFNAEGEVISAAEAEANLDRQFQEDLEEFIARADEFEELQDEFSDLEIHDGIPNQYLPLAAGAEGLEGNLMDPEAEQAFEEFLQGFSSQEKPKYGYSSRHWSPNS